MTEEKERRAARRLELAIAVADAALERNKANGALWYIEQQKLEAAIREYAAFVEETK